MNIHDIVVNPYWMIIGQPSHLVRYYNKNDDFCLVGWHILLRKPIFPHSLSVMREAYDKGYKLEDLHSVLHSNK